MGGPGERGFGQDLAPRFSLVVEGVELTSDVSRFVKELEFESAVDMADMLKVTFFNPGFGKTEGSTGPDLVLFKALQPGNQVDLFLGYGDSMTFIGRTILSKHLPFYPSSGVPILTVIGYDKSHLMMNMEGDIAGGGQTKVRFDKDQPFDKVRGFDSTKTGQPPGESGKTYPNKEHHKIVVEKANDWGMMADVDDVKVKKQPKADEGIVQPRGCSDYKFLKMLANINDFEFWVDWDREFKMWVLHWKEPVRVQRPQYTLVYNNGDRSSLLEFDTEYGLRDTISEVSVLAWDESRHTWVAMGVIESAEGKDPIYRKGGGLEDRYDAPGGRDPKAQREESEFTGVPFDDQRAAAAAATDALILENLHSGKFRLAAAGVAIDVVPDKPFETLDQCMQFAWTWFHKRRDSFIVGKGKTVGIETLTPRRVHRLAGLGPRLGGDYYFQSVSHRVVPGKSLAYTNEFVANKVIKDE